MPNRKDLKNFIPLSLICLGVLCLIYGAVLGDVQVGLFLIIPFILVSGPIAGLAILFIFLGFVLYPYFAVDRIVSTTIIPESHIGPNVDNPTGTADGSIPSCDPSSTTEGGLHPSTAQKKPARGGGLVFIGPIPIIFGDKESMKYLLPFSILILILMIIATFLF